MADEIRDGEEYHAKNPWEPSDDKRSVQLPSEWWDRQSDKPIMVTQNAVAESLLDIIELASEGRLNRIDLQVIVAIARARGQGGRTLGRTCNINPREATRRIHRIKTLLNAL